MGPLEHFGDHLEHFGGHPEHFRGHLEHFGGPLEHFRGPGVLWGSLQSTLRFLWRTLKAFRSTLGVPPEHLSGSMEHSEGTTKS